MLSYSLFRIFRLMATTSILQKRAQALGVAIGCGILSIFPWSSSVWDRPVFSMPIPATTLLPVVDYPIFDTTYLQALPFACLAALGAVMLSIIKYGFLGTWRIGPLDLTGRSPRPTGPFAWLCIPLKPLFRHSNGG